MAGTTLYALHDKRLCIRWSGGVPHRAVETILEYHGLQPVEGESADWTMQTGDRCDKPAEAVFVAAHDSGLALWQVAEIYFIVHTSGALCIDLGRGWVTGTLPASDEGISTELYVAITLTLLLLLEADGFFAVHAACLVSPEGQGVLLVGPSDSGKSTMALHLVSQGWRYLTDDSVLLFEAEDGVGVLPLRRDFCFDPEAEVLFPALRANQDRMLTDADKWRVQMDGIYPEQRQASCRAALLLFPQIVSGREMSEVQRMRPVEALTALLPQASLLRRDAEHARTFTQLMGRLVAQAPAYRFLSGADVHQDGAHLARLIHPLLPPAHVETQA